MASEDLTINETNGVHVVSVKTDNLLSLQDVSRIGSELNALVTSGVTKLVLDLKSVVYAGSATLGMLLSLREKMQESKGKLILASIDNLEKLFSLSRTKSLFEIVATPADAIPLFKK